MFTNLLRANGVSSGVFSTLLVRSEPYFFFPIFDKNFVGGSGCLISSTFVRLANRIIWQSCQPGCAAF